MVRPGFCPGSAAHEVDQLTDALPCHADTREGKPGALQMEDEMVGVGTGHAVAIPRRPFLQPAPHGFILRAV
jgi:hypothetical protein